MLLRRQHKCTTIIIKNQRKSWNWLLDHLLIYFKVEFCAYIIQKYHIFLCLWFFFVFFNEN